MRHVFRPAIRGRGVALVLLLATGTAALAGSADEAYVAARDKAVAELAAAEKSGVAVEELDKRDAAARKDLQGRMSTLLGPLAFKGLKQTPAFSPGTLMEGNIETGDPDGLVFTNEGETTRLLVSPEPVFANWLAGRAKEENAAPVLARGIKAAAESDDFFTLAISSDAAFTGYVALPVTAGEGETVRAAFGLFSQDVPENRLPDSIVILRVGNGRVVMASSEAKIAIKALPACDKVWKAGAAKAKALRTAAEKSRKQDDPRWDAANKADMDASTAYRACFAREAQGQPFLADVVKQAQALLETARGN